MVIGFLSGLANNFSSLIVPIVVFGLVFYFLKFPPTGGFRFAKRYNSKSSHGKDTFSKKKRKNPFRVIDGKFKEEDDDMPRYH